jgi:hypothetical protein
MQAAIFRLPLSFLSLAAVFLPRFAFAALEYRSADGTHSVRLAGYVKTLALGLNHAIPGEKG